MFNCGYSLSEIWKKLLGHVGPAFWAKTRLVQVLVRIGPGWARLGQVGPVWVSLGQIGQDLARLGQIEKEWHDFWILLIFMLTCWLFKNLCYVEKDEIIALIIIKFQVFKIVGFSQNFYTHTIEGKNFLLHIFFCNNLLVWSHIFHREWHFSEPNQWNAFLAVFIFHFKTRESLDSLRSKETNTSDSRATEKAFFPPKLWLL